MTLKKLLKWLCKQRPETQGAKTYFAHVVKKWTFKGKKLGIAWQANNQGRKIQKRGHPIQKPEKARTFVD